MNSIQKLARIISMGEYYIVYRKIDDFNKSLFFSQVSKFDILRPSFRYWYADPIPYKISGQVYVFMEMMDYRLQKGCIGVSKFDENGKLSRPQVIISEKFHMSFPHIFEYKGDILMVPETSVVNQLRIYRMGKDIFHWELIRIFDNVGKLVDTISFLQEDKLYFCACESSEDPYKTRMRLFLLNDVYEGSLVDMGLINDEYLLDCRNAGSFFMFNNKIYRVSQSSTADEYGVDMTLREVILQENMKFYELPIRTIGTNVVDVNIFPIIQKKKGIHTYGICGEYEVLDLLVGKISLKKFLQTLLRSILKNKLY